MLSAPPGNTGHKPPPCVDNKIVTFGSFNNLAKISPQTISAWVALLKKVPEATLILKSLFIAEEKSWKKMIQEFAEHGIDPDRIKAFTKTSTQFDHLDLYNKVDIALDTFPYNGTTTTCEALWMGGAGHHAAWRQTCGKGQRQFA